MSIFKKDRLLGADNAAPARYKIRITTADGTVLYWHKRGRLHVVDEDVARVFVSNFNRDLFGIQEDGSFVPAAGAGASTRTVKDLAMERASTADEAGADA